MKKGFTLIELLIVIAIIAIIAGAVLVAMNPAKRICDANNGQRWEETNSILSAIQQYVVDNTGTLPQCANTVSFNIDATDREITNVDDAVKCNLLILVTNGYLASMATDPSLTAGQVTGYTVSKLATGGICVKAPNKCDVGGTNPDIRVCR